MPQPKRFQFTSSDGLSIACVKWSGHHDPRGVIQIAHGLGEHMGRYQELAEKLVEGEFVVYGNDHRGHGLTAKPSGSFADFGPGGLVRLLETLFSWEVSVRAETRGKLNFYRGKSWVWLPPHKLFLIQGHSFDGLA